MSASEDACSLQVLATPKKLSYLPALPPIDIEFTDLTYTVPDGRKGSKKILRGVSGLFRSGELTAILGPSGAGKSTLLNILAGYRCIDVTGNINMNGNPRNPAQFKKMSRYIMQQDLLQPMLSVWECLRIAADLKLGKTLSSEQKIVAIEEILAMLRLEGTKCTQTSRLSGGERKRLSIALELVDNPPIIFLDEPTTGLDDLSSSLCIKLLKSLAEGGRTVICSVHTPSASLFALFDHVYVVADGQCVFRGNGSDIVPFLASVNLHCPLHYNPADFVIEVSSGEYGEHIEKMTAVLENTSYSYRWHQESSLGKGPNSNALGMCTTPLQNRENQYNFESSSWVQFQILVHRKLLQSWRDKSYICLRLVMNIFIGLVVGGIFFQFGSDGSKTIFNYGFCFCCAIMNLYVPLMPVLLEYPTEVQLLKREYFNRWYSFNAYFFAATISRLPAIILLSPIYFIIAYPMTGQPLELSRALLFLGFSLLIGLVAESMGLAIASSLGVVNGMFVGPASCVPLMLLAVYGVGQNIEYTPFTIRIGMFLSFVRYGLEGLTLAIYGNGRRPLKCPPDIDLCEFNNPKELLRQMGMSQASLHVAFIGLTVSFIVFRAVSYVLLRWRLSSYRSFPALNYVGHMIKRHLNVAHER